MGMRDPVDDKMPTTSQRIDTGYGRMYVNITHDDGEPFEVFIKKGDSGGFTNAWCQALGIAISWGLRHGGNSGELADLLMGLRTDKVANDNGDTIYSIPDGVGVAMRRFIDDKVGESIRDEDEEPMP